MSIVYRTYLHTIMENNKVVFLCLILLLVLIVSNYMKPQEGFVIYGCPIGMSAGQCAVYKGLNYAASGAPSKKTSSKKSSSKSSFSKSFSDAFKTKSSSSKKKKSWDITKSPRQIAREEANKVKKIANSAMTEAKKALAAAQTSTISSNRSSVKKGRTTEKLNQYLQQMQTLAKNTETLTKNAEQKIKENDALSRQVLEKATGLDANAKQISNSAAKIDAEIARISNIANSTEKNANGVLTQVSGKAASIDKSVEVNKGIQNEINGKVGGIDKQIEISKNNTDTVVQIKNEVDRIMTEFKANSETMMKTMQLAIDKMNANQIPAKQGFQNMNDPVLQASDSLKKDMESAKLLAFTTIDSAYNGDLHLETPWTNSAGTNSAGTVGTNSMEGFDDTTTAHSAYVNPSDISKLEKDVLTAFSDFNTKYFDVYQKCLHDRRKTQDRIKNGERGLVMPQCGRSLTGQYSGFLQDVINAKNVLVGKIATLNSAIVAMGKKPESTIRTDGTYVIANRKVTEQLFMGRHNRIKELHNNITTMRSDLDMKMANLLDKTKGPLPEAQNKYNFENYATIGWSVLATSILYYTFVEMK